MLLSVHDAGLGAIGAAHEYGMSQWEINLTHSNALDAADRAFRFKAAIKDLATREGLLATFMGKPFNADAGSGFHLHLSLCGEGGANAFADSAGEEGCAHLLRHFIAGVIAHAPALMAFLNPTVTVVEPPSQHVQAIALRSSPFQLHDTGHGGVGDAGRVGPVAGVRVAEERPPHVAAVIHEEVVVACADTRRPPLGVRALEVVRDGDNRVVLVLHTAGAGRVVGVRALPSGLVDVRSHAAWRR